MSDFQVNQVNNLDDWNQKPTQGDSLLEDSTAMQNAGLEAQEEESKSIEEIGAQSSEGSLLEQSKEVDPAKAEETVKKDENEDPSKQKEEANTADVLTLDKITSNDLVQELIEKKVLLPWEGDKVETSEDLIELIQNNMDHKLQEVNQQIFDDRLASLPPQYQSIMKYGLNGGQDVQALINSWGEVEQTFNTDISTTEGQESVVKQYLLETGYGSEAMIDKDIKTWTDLGVLEEKATAFKPALEESQMRKVHALEQQQQMQVQQEQQFHQHHMDVIGHSLTSFQLEGADLDRETKGRLFEAAQPQYQSQITGRPIDALEAIVEELKYGQNQDPNLYLELMYFASDPEGFKENLRSSIRSTQAKQRQRTLQTEIRKDISGGHEGLPNHTQQNSTSNNSSW
jgi:hypothetical protein